VCVCVWVGVCVCEGPASGTPVALSLLMTNCIWQQWPKKYRTNIKNTKEI